MNLQLLMEKDAEEIKEAIVSENLNNKTQEAMTKIELNSENPRQEVLDMLGYEPEPVKSEETGEEQLEFNPKLSFSMVHYDGLKHYYQNGCIFDRGDKKLLVDKDGSEVRNKESK